jgi:6-phosphogluconolactonase (cycloisomerase 2 family)
MRFNRRSFHRTAAAVMALGALAVASQGAIGQSLSRAAVEEGGLRSGKIFTSTNSAAGNEVLVLGAGPSGALALLASVPTQGLGSGAGLGSQGAVALSSDGRHLFVVNAGSNSVSTFAVRAGGLTLLSVHDAGGLHPISVSERDGLVYVLNDGGSGNIAGFRDNNGTLVPVAGSVQPLSAAGGTGPAQVAIGTEGDVLVVTEKNTSRLVSYALAADGSAGAPKVTGSAGATPFGFVFDRRNHLLVSEAGASTLSSYGFSSAAPTTPVVISPAVPTNQAAACWAMVTPNGRFVYTGNAGSNSISQYAIDRRGAVALVAAAAGSTGAGGAGDLAIAGHGRTLAILAPKAPAVFSYAIAADGSLTPTGSVAGLPAGVVGLAAN